ncbi:MAG: hypothetical protein GY761_16070 [Hyphomicrobiales bacterium]|nr:hypothetical protein [Hyphomicrobiales bacterium]
MNSAALREKAFDQFKKVAKSEQPNGAETLAYRRLVPLFSTAPKEETDGMMLLMNYWSRNGHGEWLIEAGRELYNWAQTNGYHYR